MKTKTPMTGGDVRPTKPTVIKHTPIRPGRVGSVRWPFDRAPQGRYEIEGTPEEKDFRREMQALADTWQPGQSRDEFLGLNRPPLSPKVDYEWRSGYTAPEAPEVAVPTPAPKAAPARLIARTSAPKPPAPPMPARCGPPPPPRS
ncbi:MAG: hypothetical protein ACT6QU_19115 [Aliihoeflea sp.]|uniref:hypothetical protein n=1 Tax=Aliihoeflea sp. TaxID=2608088 RepID=UPI004034C86C